MSLSREIVEYVARLSALKLTPEEIERMGVELGDTLEFVAQLQKVPTDDVEPTSHVHGAINAFRDDLIKPSMSLDKIREFAPDFQASGFKVPKIL